MEGVLSLCWCWLCVSGGYESSQCALITFLTWSHSFLVVHMSSGCGGAAKSLKKADEFFQKHIQSKHAFLMVASKKGRHTATVHLKKKEKKSKDVGDEGEYRGEWRMDWSWLMA